MLQLRRPGVVDPTHHGTVSQSPRENREIDGCPVLQREEDVLVSGEPRDGCENAQASCLEAFGRLGAVVGCQIAGDEVVQGPFVIQVEEAQVEPMPVKVREQRQLKAFGASAAEIPPNAEDPHSTTGMVARGSALVDRIGSGLRRVDLHEGRGWPDV